ncbi:hypothetical protein [Endozoicomonas euniceicola]|uniref:Uncharacterized protein n=1 Tax=Endozoicomonas euniceicola TaxID=1234143 RepID=A0ABY6GZG9_9GAMM|nr:hypothetical protein [Endozoicomonas euniceicola]UYM18198.1 hypothetical protein NX720_09925 [Endozoicomonas euniceicola]
MQILRINRSNLNFTHRTCRGVMFLSFDCLALSIAHAGRHSLVTRLDYKAKQSGKHQVNIDQWLTSSLALNPGWVV